MNYNWHWKVLLEMEPGGTGSYLHYLLVGLLWTLATALAAWLIALSIGAIVGTLRRLVEAANAIALEATLSFLGLGLPPTEPSLGMLIANGFQYMLSGRYWISIYPGIALIVIGVALLVGAS